MRVRSVLAVSLFLSAGVAFAQARLVPGPALPPPAQGAQLGFIDSALSNVSGCPTGTLRDLGISAESCPTSGACSKTYSWSRPTGWDASTTYEVFTANVADYCAFAATINLTLAGTTAQTSFTTSMPMNVATAVRVRVTGCVDVISPYTLVSDTFQSAPAKPVASVKETSPGQVTVGLVQSDARTSEITAIERASAGGTFSPLPFSLEQGHFVTNFCPAGSQKSYVDANVAPGTYQYRLKNFGNFATNFEPVTSDPVSITVVGSETCSLTCTATGATTATVGESVSFSASAAPTAACSGALTHLWDFGDGTQSVLQNPVKVYTKAGTYSWTFRVASAAGGLPCTKSGTITVTDAASCSLTCTASAPSTATAGDSVSFAASATPTGTCPGALVHLWDFGDGTQSVDQNPRKVYTKAGTYSWSFRVTSGPAQGGPSCTKTGTIVIASGCPTPATPVIGPLPSTVPSGRAISVSWTAPSAVTGALTYLFETSRDGFRTVESSLSSRAASAVVTPSPSPAEYTLSFRVKGIAACGAHGAFSAVKSVQILRAAAAFIVTRSSTALSAVVGQPAAPGSVTFRNVGAVSGSVALSAPQGGFVTVSPPNLNLAPGAEGTFTVAAAASALSTEGFYQGVMGYGSADSLGCSLTVVAENAPKALVKASASSVVFSAPAGQNPPSQTITVIVASQSTAGTVNLTPSIGPGGSWLTLRQSAAGAPIPAGKPITLTVDRSKRGKDEGVPPLRTLIRFTPVGGDPATDAAVVEVIDNEPVQVIAGAGGRSAAGREGTEALAVSPPPGGTSFIIPTAVNATGGSGSVFTSDGWIKNQSLNTVSADLYYTPQGKDGLTDQSVLKATVTLPAGNTARLSDLMGSYFQASGTGQVEVRSESPNELSVRTRVDSIRGGDAASRYSTEIPTVPYGAGTYLGGPELVVPGIDSDVANRANLILAETTGASADVRVTVYDVAGAMVGSPLERSIPPYGKLQVDRLVDQVAPGRTLSGGWAGVVVTGGAGHVVPVVTVIDNRSDSFSAIQGKRALESAPGARSALAGPSVYVIPTAVRTVGANNTQFLTSLSLVNGTASPARLTLVYHYVDQDDGGAVKESRQDVTIVGRGSLSKQLGADVILNLFGVTNRSFGYFTIEGDAGKVVGVGAISAQVDPTDPSKGMRTAQVNGTYLDAPEVLALGDVETRFAGAEKSVQKRTNLVLVELGGQPVDVIVRVASSTGTLLAQRTVSIGAGQYFQITDLFGDQGVQLGEGPFQNMEVTAQVLGGTGRVLAVATVNDNISRNPEIFLLKAPGPGEDTIGF